MKKYTKDGAIKLVDNEEVEEILIEAGWVCEEKPKKETKKKDK